MNLRLLAILFLYPFLVEARNSQVVAQTGFFYEFASDGAVASPAQKTIQLQRYYTSEHPVAGVFGNGWCSAWDQKLIFKDKQPQFFRKCASESLQPFSSGAAFWVTPDGSELRRQSSAWRLRVSGQELVFSDEGKLQEIYENGRRVLRISYGPAADFQVTYEGVATPIQFKADAKTKLVSEISYGQKKAHFSYNGANLFRAVNFWGNTYSYEYTQNSRLKKVTYPDKTTQVISYDQNLKVTAVKDRQGCEEKIAGRNAQRISVRRLCKAEKQTLNFSPSPRLLSDRAVGRVKKDRAGRTISFQKNGFLIKKIYEENRARPYRIEVANLKDGKTQKTFNYEFYPGGLLNTVTLSADSTRSKTQRLKAVYGHNQDISEIQVYENNRQIHQQNLKSSFRARDVASQGRPTKNYFLIWVEAMSLLEAQP